MPGDKQRAQAAHLQLPLQLRQRFHRQFVILRQRGNEAVSAVRPEPDRIAGKEITIVNEINHMPPRMAGHEEALDPDAVDFENLPVPQQHLFIVDRHLRQLVEAVDHLSAHSAGQIAVLHLAYVQRRVSEQPGAVGFHRAHMVRVLMGDENMANLRRIDAQPAHLFLQPVVVVSRVDHDRRPALAVKEDIRHPFAHAGHVLVDPARVERLKNLFAAVHFAHFLFLELGCLSGHFLPLPCAPRALYNEPLFVRIL